MQVLRACGGVRAAKVMGRGTSCQGHGEGYELPRSWGGVRAAKVMGNPGVLGTQTKNDIMQTWNIFPIEAARATLVDFTNQ